MQDARGRGAVPVATGRLAFARGHVSTLSSNSAIRDLAERIPLALLAIDRNRIIELANGPARQLFGERIRGADIAVALREPDFTETLERALTDAAPQQVDITLYRGARRNFHVWIEPHGTSAGGATICLEERTAAHRARELHRDFVANASHELRTPLATIVGCMDTLRSTARGDPQATERFMELMVAEVDRMQRLVSDLLSLNQIELQEHREPDTVIDVAELAKVAADANGVHDRAVPDTPQLVRGDRSQLLHALTNLLDNAQHYGGDGVQLQVRRTGDRIRLAVMDDGPGIEARHLPRLTERFYRVDVPTSRRSGGTGLGLAIVKHIVARHRGELQIESDLGKGSCFTIWLQAAR